MSDIKNKKSTIRTIRNFFVQTILAFTRALFFWLPNEKARGHALQLIHPFCGLIPISIFFLLPARSGWKILIAVSAVLVMISQIAFRGCVIARAELILTGDNKTIIDPFLVAADLPLENTSRTVATIASGTAIAALLVLGTIIDYIKNVDTLKSSSFD